MHRKCHERLVNIWNKEENVEGGGEEHMYREGKNREDRVGGKYVYVCNMNKIRTVQ